MFTEKYQPTILFIPDLSAYLLSCSTPYTTLRRWLVRLNSEGMDAGNNIGMLLLTWDNRLIATTAGDGCRHAQVTLRRDVVALERAFNMF